MEGPSEYHVLWPWLIIQPRKCDHRSTNRLRQIVPSSNDLLQISVNQSRFEPLKAARMQRICSAPLLAIHASARRLISCAVARRGFDSRRNPFGVAHDRWGMQFRQSLRLQLWCGNPTASLGRSRRRLAVKRDARTSPFHAYPHPSSDRDPPASRGTMHKRQPRAGPKPPGAHG